MSACTTGDRQEQLELKEQQLTQKEQQLLDLDQKLKIKERELSQWELQLDSLKKQGDTVGMDNPQLIGSWLVTMQCTETTCDDYAVGDTKTEHWNIDYLNNKFVAKAISNNKVIRTYSGLFQNNSLELSAVPHPDGNIKINVALAPHPANKDLMEGQRVIERGNHCRVVFSLKFEKQ
jgi:hypothetical protein